MNQIPRESLLHPFKRSESQQAHRSTQHIPGADIQPHPRPSLLDVLLALNNDGLPCARDGVAETEGERDDGAGFVRLDGGLNDIGIRAKQEDDVPSGLLSEEVGVDGSGLRKGKEFGVLPLDRGNTDVGILEVRPSVALKREHAIPVEGIVVDAIQRASQNEPLLLPRWLLTAWQPCPES